MASLMASEASGSQVSSRGSEVENDSATSRGGKEFF